MLSRLNQKIAVGNKTLEWILAKQKLIEIYFEKGVTRCENCGSRHILSFHHRPKRSSQEAVHDFEHTRLLCADCHEFFEHHDELDKKLFEKQRGFNPQFEIKIMAEKQKEQKVRKSDWQRNHECKNCKKTTGFLLCDKCGHISV